jgi:hypothetical protein
MASNTLGLAKEYLRWGFVPLLLRPVHMYPDSCPMSRRKGPLLKGWPDETRETAMKHILRALEKYHYTPMNVGVLCGIPSGITVVDVDIKNDGLTTWEAVEAKYGAINTFRVRTGGGGLHLYFKYANIRSSIGLSVGGKKVGIDIRGDESQVVGPWSIHPSTHKQYEIIGGEKDGMPILANLPTWFSSVFSLIEEDGHNYYAEKAKKERRRGR